jgi:hypothetical protein
MLWNRCLPSASKWRFQVAAERSVASSIWRIAVTLCLQGDKDGHANSKNFITEIKHHFFLGHGEGRRDTATIILLVLAEIAHGVGLVVALAFQA